MELSLVKPGNKAGSEKISLSDEAFGRDYNEPLVHQTVVTFLAGSRQGSVKQKNRSEVRGGGRKPWRQKGTGRARAGTIRSPIWRSGGKTFTGQADWSQKVNKKMFRAAMKCILSEFARANNLVVINELDITDHKTKSFLKVAKPLGLDDATYILHELTMELFLSSRNIHTVSLFDAYGIDPYNLYRSKKLVFTKEALKQIEERLL